MGEGITIGLDIAKSVFQLLEVDNTCAVVSRKRVSRTKMLEFFAEPPRAARHNTRRRCAEPSRAVRWSTPSWLESIMATMRLRGNSAAATVSKYLIVIRWF